MLKPYLYDYRATDVSPAAMDAMMEIGYQEAKAKMQDVKNAIKDFKRKKD